MKRGDVYWVDLAPRSGSEQQGRRPAVIVSTDSLNLAPNWYSLIVAPITTSAKQARRDATVVILPAGEGGLSKESVVLCHQLTTLDRSKILQRIGELSDAWLAQVEEAIVAALDLP